MQKKPEMDRFFAEGIQKTYRKRSIIFDSDTDPSGLHCITAGRVKASVLNDSGQEFILYTLGKGQFFPLKKYFADDECNVTYTAETEVKTSWQTREKLDDYLDSHPLLLKYILKEVLHLMCTRINTLTRSQSDERVLRRILELAEKFGERGEHGVKLSMTQQELADSVSLSRESVCLILNRLEAKTVVKLGRNQIWVNPEKTRNQLKKLGADI